MFFSFSFPYVVIYVRCIVVAIMNHSHVASIILWNILALHQQFILGTFCISRPMSSTLDPSEELGNGNSEFSLPRYIIFLITVAIYAYHNGAMCELPDATSDEETFKKFFQDQKHNITVLPEQLEPLKLVCMKLFLFCLNVVCFAFSSSVFVHVAVLSTSSLY